MKYIRLFPNASIRDAVLAEIEHSVLSYTEGEGMLLKPVSITPQPNDEIWYTSTDSNIVNPNTVAFGTGITVVSNTYSNGKGVIKLSGDATTIGRMAFYGCMTLGTITIPNSVTSIDEDAFGYCMTLGTITIPDSVTSIGNGAFDECSSLTSITCLGINPPTLTSNYTFTYSSCPIYVPAGSVETYKVATNWSRYASRIQAIQ